MPSIMGERRIELRAFLKTRRERLRPEDVGLVAGPRRHVKGLSREEVAELAGIGPGYYTWIEQGRPLNVSAQVLGRIAFALRLDEAEREHLYALASGEVPDDCTDGHRDLHPSVLHAVRGMNDVAALVLDHTCNVLCWNAIADELFELGAGPEVRRNAARWMFFDPQCRARLPEWEPAARHVLSVLRRAYARDPREPGLARVLGALERSDRFRQLWERYDIEPCPGVRQRSQARAIAIEHPATGRVEMIPCALGAPDQSDVFLLILTPADEESARRLKRLPTAARKPA